MRNTKYKFIDDGQPDFIGTEKAEKTQQVTETEAKPEAAQPAPAPEEPKAPEKPFFEKYKTLLLIALAVVVVVFFWKFKIVSKAAQIVTA